MKLVLNELQLPVQLKILDAVRLELILDYVCHGSSVLGFLKLNFKLKTNVSYGVWTFYYGFCAVFTYCQLFSKQRIIL